MNYICFDGRLLPSTEPVLLAGNRSYRYGDGLFETVKIRDGRMVLEVFHFERLFGGLSLLGYKVPKHFTTSQISDEILLLCQKNDCEKSARVRLSVSRGDGGLYDTGQTMHYLVEAWPLTAGTFNETGLAVDIFPGARKSCDHFSHLKSANFLPYVMAARFAHDQHLDDALVLNSYGRIADSTIANVFIIKDNTIITPPLSEGGVDGVMRRWIREQGTRHKEQGTRDESQGLQPTAHSLPPEPTLPLPILERPLEITDLEQADEIFLTNAIQGIRWVRQFRDKTYENTQTKKIYESLQQTI